MFTGGPIWILTHRHVRKHFDCFGSRRARGRSLASAPGPGAPEALGVRQADGPVLVGFEQPGFRVDPHDLTLLDMI